MDATQGLSKEAKAAARGAVLQIGGTPRHLDVALTAAYPIFRAEVIAEVVEALREDASLHGPTHKGWYLSAVDYIERHFAEGS